MALTKPPMIKNPSLPGNLKMQLNPDSGDVWKQTIGLLSLIAGAAISDVDPQASSALTRVDRARPKQLGSGPKHVSVKLIDRPDAKTATIAWCDSTQCCYGDQIWRFTRSRVNGVCAMSGREIRTNDAVFKPRRLGSSPLNAHAMILAVVLDDVM